MELKFLSKKEQLVLLEKPNAKELLREYASLGEDFIYASMQKIWESDPKSRNVVLECIGRLEDETQLKIFKTLSVEDAKEIQSLCGNIYPEVFVKMLEVFPRLVAKEILIEYGKSCYMWEEPFLKVLELYPWEAKEIIVACGVVSKKVLKKLLKMFPKKYVKDFLVEAAEADGVISDESQLEILGAFEENDAMDIFKACISNVTGLCNDAQLVILDMFSKKNVKEIFKLAVENREYLSSEVLKEIIRIFPKKEAKYLVTSFFSGDCGRDKYDEDDKEIIMSLL